MGVESGVLLSPLSAPFSPRLDRGPIKIPISHGQLFRPPPQIESERLCAGRTFFRGIGHIRAICIAASVDRPSRVEHRSWAHEEVPREVNFHMLARDILSLVKYPSVHSTLPSNSSPRVSSSFVPCVPLVTNSLPNPKFSG
jgi:hypothetical protein